MTLRTLLCLPIVCLCGWLCAQSAPADTLPPAELTAGDLNYLLGASRPAKADRYEGVRGTPYRYKNFGPAVLFDTALNPYALDSANYNGFSSQFEFYHEGQLREANGNVFVRGQINNDAGEEHLYVYGINLKFRDRYAEVVYLGEFVTGTVIYDVKNDEKIVESVGETIKLRRFSPKTLNYAMVDGDFVTIKTAAKPLAESLGFKSELTKFIKANKLKGNRPEDLIKIYAETDRLLAEQ